MLQLFHQLCGYYQTNQIMIYRKKVPEQEGFATVLMDQNYEWLVKNLLNLEDKTLKDD